MSGLSAEESWRILQSVAGHDAGRGRRSEVELMGRALVSKKELLGEIARTRFRRQSATALACVVSGAARRVSWHPEDTCGCFGLPGVGQWRLAASRVSTLSPVAKAKPSKNTLASPLCNGCPSLPCIAPFLHTTHHLETTTRLPHTIQIDIDVPEDNSIFFVFFNITPESATLPRSQHRSNVGDRFDNIGALQLYLSSLRCTNCKTKDDLRCQAVNMWAQDHVHGAEFISMPQDAPSRAPLDPDHHPRRHRLPPLVAEIPPRQLSQCPSRTRARVPHVP